MYKLEEESMGAERLETAFWERLQLQVRASLVLVERIGAYDTGEPERKQQQKLEGLPNI